MIMDMHEIDKYKRVWNEESGHVGGMDWCSQEKVLEVIRLGARPQYVQHCKDCRGGLVMSLVALVLSGILLLELLMAHRWVGMVFVAVVVVMCLVVSGMLLYDMYLLRGMDPVRNTPNVVELRSQRFNKIYARRRLWIERIVGAFSNQQYVFLMRGMRWVGGACCVVMGVMVLGLWQGGSESPMVAKNEVTQPMMEQPAVVAPECEEQETVVMDEGSSIEKNAIRQGQRRLQRETIVEEESEVLLAKNTEEIPSAEYHESTLDLFGAFAQVRCNKSCNADSIVYKCEQLV